MKEMLAEKKVNDPYVRERFKRDSLPMLMFMESVGDSVFSDIESIQADEDNPNDCAKVPHDVTHAVDGLRYLVISRVMAAQEIKPEVVRDEDELMDCDEYMMGGVISRSYMGV